MRKYIIGTLFGFALSFTISAYATDIKSFIGKTIQGEYVVRIEGKPLDRKAVVIDGVSYLPVRVIGEAVGYNATFNKDTGIDLTMKEGANQMENQIAETTPSPVPQATITPASTIEELDKKIETLRVGIAISEGALQTGTQSTEGKERTEKALIRQKAELADLEKQKEALTQ